MRTDLNLELQSAKRDRDQAIADAKAKQAEENHKLSERASATNSAN